jgi:hypothetical protein
LLKGKVAQACEWAGQYHSRLAEAERMAYLRDLEAWRKSANIAGRGRFPPQPPTDTERVTAKRLIDMADACSFSTGDVYVSADLWNQIKGYYDVV